MTRVVVVGNGMAGSRAASELLARDPSLDVLVLGAENRPAYNRVLLTDVLAGRRGRHELDLPVPAARHHLGAPVVQLDRAARTVRSADGLTAGYDVLVLATGSDPVVPPVHGVAEPDGSLRDGVQVLRTAGDCDAIAEHARRAPRAVVIGGGLLGLEAARGLLQRGLQVALVHGGPHLMDTQLDPLAGAVLRGAVEALGVPVHLGQPAARVLGTRSVQGVGLADGTAVPGTLVVLVVLACGVRPQTALARRAGLAVDRGVLVDDQLRTSDPRVLALGDCAQHRGTVHALVAPAWEQAAVIADVVTGRIAAYRGSRPVTRLKALGLDVAAMGETAPRLEDAGPGLDVVVWADPARHVYKKLVVRDGVLAGALLVGDVSTAGAVAQAFTSGLPLPPDRTHLLLCAPPAGGALEDDAVVCACNGVTAGALRRSGCRTAAQAAAATRATTGCGTCTSSVAALLAAAPQGVPA